MVPNPEDNTDRPFWYAQVVGIFHVNVIFCSNEHWRVEFLWVRWFGHDYSYKSGFKHRRLPRLGFVPDDQQPMGFVDPADVICGAHLIPAFHYGRTNIYLRPSIARILTAEGQRPEDDDDEDWVYYYANMCVERLDLPD
jgi:hypothetical protein